MTRDECEAPLQHLAGSSVTWANGSAERASLCIVYLHGWGASPLEIDPVDERVAASLGATLLRYRLTAHGLSPLERGANSLAEVQSAVQLRRDAATAHALGELLGERVVLFGTSTGGTLSVWLASQSWVRAAAANAELAAIVLTSPGFQIVTPLQAVAKPLGWLLALLPRPASGLLLRLLTGSRKLKPRSPALTGARGEAQQRIWNRVQPIEAALTVIGLYAICGATCSLEDLDVPVLAFACPDDRTVSFYATRAAMRRMPRAELDVMHGPHVENAHVLTGAVASPGSVDHVVERTVVFLKRELSKSGSGERTK